MPLPGHEPGSRAAHRAMARPLPALEARVGGIEHQGFEQVVALAINQLLLVDPGARCRHYRAVPHRIRTRGGGERGGGGGDEGGDEGGDAGGNEGGSEGGKKGGSGGGGGDDGGLKRQMERQTSILWQLVAYA